jgi:hypothetical protein
MKRLIVIAIGLFCASAITLSAADAKPQKKQLTAEQKELQKEILKKYDTNNDGRLDKEERAKISKEDQEKMEKAGLRMGGGKKKAA